jgi:hypothetical protein
MCSDKYIAPIPDSSDESSDESEQSSYESDIKSRENEADDLNLGENSGDELETGSRYDSDSLESLLDELDLNIPDSLCFTELGESSDDSSKERKYSTKSANRKEVEEIIVDVFETSPSLTPRAKTSKMESSHRKREKVTVGNSCEVHEYSPSSEGLTCQSCGKTIKQFSYKISSPGNNLNQDWAGEKPELSFKKKESGIYKLLCEKNIDQKTAHEANSLYSLVSSESLKKSRPRLRLAYACVLNVLKTSGITVNPIEMANKMKISHQHANKGIKYLNRKLKEIESENAFGGKSLEDVTIDELHDYLNKKAPQIEEELKKKDSDESVYNIIPDILIKAGLSIDIYNSIKSIIEDSSKKSPELSRSMAKSIVSGAIYYYIKKTSKTKSLPLEEYSQMVGVSKNTIKNIYQNINKYEINYD